jgi:secreted trypsin-like serine protease
VASAIVATAAWPASAHSQPRGDWAATGPVARHATKPLPKRERQRAPVSPGAVPRVAGGAPASIRSFPWSAALVFNQGLYLGSDFDRQFCGGSVISPTLILTAGHCVTEYEPDLVARQIQVVTGRTVLSAFGGQRFDVGAIYLNTNPDVDLAVLSLLGEATRSPRIELPGPGERRLWLPGDRAVVAGWGDTSATDPNSDPDGLLAAGERIVSDQFCASEPAYPSFFNPATMLCAGRIEGGAGQCFGDSGSAVVVPARARRAITHGVARRWREAGVVRASDGCGTPNKPGILVRVGEASISSQVQALVSSLGGPDVTAAHGVFPCDGKHGRKLRACKRRRG